MLGVTLGTFVLKVRWPPGVKNGSPAAARCQNLKQLWYEKYIRYSGLAIAVVGGVFAIFWNIFHDFKAHKCPT